MDARLEEEAESKKILADLDGMSFDDPAFEVRFGELRSPVLAHAKAREEHELPVLRANNDERKLDKRLRRSARPRRSRPRAPTLRPAAR